MSWRFVLRARVNEAAAVYHRQYTKHINGEGCAVGRAKVCLAHIPQTIIPGFKTHRAGGERRRPKELFSALARPIDEYPGIPGGGQFYLPCRILFAPCIRGVLSECEGRLEYS